MHEELQVALCANRVGGSMRIVKGRVGQNGTSIIDGDGEEKKINIRSKGVVFLFLRSGNGPSRVNSQSSAETHMGGTGTSSLTVGLPWSDR